MRGGRRRRRGQQEVEKGMEERRGMTLKRNECNSIQKPGSQYNAGTIASCRVNVVFILPRANSNDFMLHLAYLTMKAYFLMLSLGITLIPAYMQYRNRYIAIVFSINVHGASIHHLSTCTLIYHTNPHMLTHTHLQS